MKKIILFVFVILFLASCNNDNSKISTNISTSSADSDITIKELIELAAGTYEYESDEYEYARITLTSDYSCDISFKKVNETEVAYSTKFYAEFATDGYNLDNTLSLTFSKYSSFPFEKGYYYHLSYTDDYSFTLKVQSYGISNDGSGYKIAIFNRK